MALDKKTLQMLLNNPGMVKAHELGMEDDPSQQQPEDGEQAPDESAHPDPESMLDQHPDDQQPDEEVASIPSMKTPGQAASPDIDSALMEKLKKLKAGELMDDSQESTEEDTASNMQATTDMRKKAMDMIKRKYLGQ